MNRIRAGALLALAAALISGVSVFVNGYAVKQLSDPAVFTTLKNGVAAIILIALAAATVRSPDVMAIGRRSWAALAVVGVVGGSVPFLLFFTGLSLASAPSAAFIQKTLFVWVAFLAVPVLRERLGWAQVGAMAVLLGAQVLVAAPTGMAWGIGETIIAAATLLWAIEVILARKLLTAVPPLVLGAGRMGVGLVVLLGYLVLTGKLSIISGLTTTQWAWAVGTGVLLAGYVATWFAALRRAPATVVTSVLVVGAPITALLDAITRGALPPSGLLAGYGLVALATAVLTVTCTRRARPGLASAASG